MTDLNNLAPAAAAAGASLPLPASSSSVPPVANATAAPAASLVAPSPLDPGKSSPSHYLHVSYLLVATALSGLTSAVDAAHIAAIALADSSVGRLTVALDDLAAALEEIASVAAEVGAAVSSALVPAPASTPPATNAIRMTGPWTAGALYGVVPAAPLTAIPESAVEKWFAITRGTYVGLTKNSAISLQAVNGISSALSDRCATQALALAHFNGALAAGAVAVIA